MKLSKTGVCDLYSMPYRRDSNDGNLENDEGRKIQRFKAWAFATVVPSQSQTQNANDQQKEID